MRTTTFKDWFTNFGTVFSILGFFATIYLGIFYVPKWLQQSQNEKELNAENEILQSVKELIFSDSTLTLNELPSLVHAKEIYLNEKFPLSLDDILIKTEESFMEDRFLPLTKRKELIEKIEIIKQKLPKTQEVVIGKQKEQSRGLSWLSIIGSITAVILGLISTFIKYKLDRDKEVEIQNEILKPDYDEESNYEFEKNIENILKNRSDIHVEDKSEDDNIDIVFTKNNKWHFIEAKYLTKSKIGLPTFRLFSYYLSDKVGEGWLIYNTDITPLVKGKIEEFNKEYKNVQIKLIRVTNSKEFSEKLDELLL